jgi:hypothetical protein
MLLNFLKILGLALSSLSAVIATLKETKTSDKKHITPAGKTLLALGILGFVIALGAQLQQWEVSQTEEQVSRERTERLLIEIRRAVTKFDAISMDISYNWPMTEPEFTTYRERITRLTQRINEKSPYLGAGQVQFGLRVVTRTPDRAKIFSPSPGSEAFPGKNDGAAEWYYSRVPRAHIALYKKPIQPSQFDAFFEGRQNFADLILVPRDGKETLLFVPDDNGQLSSADYRQTGMQIPNETWSPTGLMRSIEDLSESTAVIFLPSGTPDAVRHLWILRPPQLTLYFNNQRFLIESSELVLEKGKYGIPIFIYKFPKQGAA